MSRGQRNLFSLTGVPKQCEAAQCRELAAPADILCPPHRTRHRNGLLGICISCRKWMDEPEQWGYNCAHCARRHNPTVNSRLKKKYGGHIYSQQQGRCANCQNPIAIGEGKTPQDPPVELDHIQPRRRGGRDNLDNLQLLCRRCNRRKKDMPEADFKLTRPPDRMEL